MEAEIERCYNEYQLKISDVDIAATIFRTFGKGIIKKGQISPDGFVQMAIQLANFKDQKKFSLTYESASARFYANSRTETLRTVSKDSCAFVNAMMDPNCTNDERYRLLQVACEQHVQRNRECMLGRGVDRHLLESAPNQRLFKALTDFLYRVYGDDDTVAKQTEGLRDKKRLLFRLKALWVGIDGRRRLDM
ncbi:unnamed protein product [Anisakis simplex]|uniref:LD31742p (inferred by orthology to a D. melanogaster protein) n=1 Tax=Anisakis simplex TaxID=6269 RepID=A0A0M3K4U4_ANISI|nr:unnamed protein product [Anisakis simplex]